MSKNERDPQADLALCEAATPGPWNATKDEDGFCEIINADGWVADVGLDDGDAAMIAASREALPWYICRTLELQAELAQSRREYAEEIDEFNTGYQAAKDGLPESAEPERCPHDVWRCGYAWGAFEGMKAEVERLRAELEQIKEAFSNLYDHNEACTIAVARWSEQAREKEEALRAEVERLRESLKSEQDSHGNTCEYFQNEIHRKMLAHGNSLEELVQVRALLFQLLEAVEAFAKRPVPPSPELAESFKALAEEATRIAVQAGYSPERSSLAKFWIKEQANG